MPKSDEFRFTLGFDKENPRHEQAVRIINSKGTRRKAQYIADAVLYYESSSKAANLPQAEFESVIERVLLKLMAKGTEKRTAPPKSPPKSKTLKVQAADMLGNDPFLEDAEKYLGESGVEAVANALASFRKK